MRSVLWQYAHLYVHVRSARMPATLMQASDGVLSLRLDAASV
jgi:hypothetical protein